MSAPTLTREEAMSQLEDVVLMGTGELDPDECGWTVAEQVEYAREAMRDASKVITRWKRRSARSISSGKGGPS